MSASPHIAEPTGPDKLRGTFPGWLELGALLCGIVASLVLGYWGVQHNNYGEHLRFDNEANDAAHAIHLRLRGYEEMLRGVGALLEVPRDTPRADFAAYLRTLELEARYPGLHTLSF